MMDDEEELDVEPIDEEETSNKKEPKPSFKDSTKGSEKPLEKCSQGQPKKFPELKPVEDEPEVTASFPLAKKKPNDEEELDVEPINHEAPLKKMPKPSFKDSKKANEKEPTSKVPEKDKATPTNLKDQPKRFPKLKPSDDEPKTTSALPLNRKKPRDEEELDVEPIDDEVPHKKTSKPSFKEPKKIPGKEVPKTKPSDEEELNVEPLDDKTPSRKAPKPSVKDSKMIPEKPAPKVKLPDDEEELDVEPSDKEISPKKTPKPSFKDSKKAPEKDEPLPKTLDKSKPASKAPTDPKKYPKLKEPSEEPEANATLPLSKRKPTDDSELPAEPI
ncbi:unnamed protein product, partial [Strongylus vulgaris]